MKCASHEPLPTNLKVNQLTVDDLLSRVKLETAFLAANN